MAKQPSPPSFVKKPRRGVRLPSASRGKTGSSNLQPASSSSGRKQTRAAKGKNRLPNIPFKPPSFLSRFSWSAISTERKLDILGVILALLGFLTLLSIFSPRRGLLTGWWVDALRVIAGWGSVILPLGLILLGVWLVLRNLNHFPVLSPERGVGILLLFLNLLAWIHLFAGGGWEIAEQGAGGGFIGAAFERLLVTTLGIAGTVVVLIAWVIVGLALSLDISIPDLLRGIQRLVMAVISWLQKPITTNQSPAKGDPSPAIEKPPVQHPRTLGELPPDFHPLSPSAGSSTRFTIRDMGRTHHSVPSEKKELESSPAQKDEKTISPPGGGSSSAAKISVITWRLPDITTMLEPGSIEAVKSGIDQERGRVIEETLASFGAPAHIVEIHRGPTVTQFGVEPDFVENRSGKMRVRVARIVALADDLALALAAPRIRIQAPVPGRSYVGIEVPNTEVSRVALRDVIESEGFKKLKTSLAFAVGKDVSGKPVSYDLTAMPHLLIAGTTGSGKSVCVNSILTCFLLNNTPADLRLVLVDPKRVELTGYNGIPHLLGPVVTEAEKVIGALQWMQREMDARYQRFSQVGARNIQEYNKRFAAPNERLPYLVVVVDELADLMMLAPEETERSLTRLAQLARATGIHLILATQRPSVDVVTGLIKANFPARIAFAVASNTDSRVILDQPGAERLLGRGDMLFQAPDAPSPVRLQGVWVSDAEIQKVVEHWREQSYTLSSNAPEPATAIPVDMSLPAGVPLKQTPLWEDGTQSDDDPLLKDAIEIVKKEQKASISMLQRKMRVGYTRAARLIDRLEELRIIGPAQATSQVREVLVPPEDSLPQGSS